MKLNAIQEKSLYKLPYYDKIIYYFDKDKKEIGETL